LRYGKSIERDREHYKSLSFVMIAALLVDREAVEDGSSA